MCFPGATDSLVTNRYILSVELTSYKAVNSDGVFDKWLSFKITINQQKTATLKRSISMPLALIHGLWFHGHLGTG